MNRLLLLLALGLLLLAGVLLRGGSEPEPALGQASRLRAEGATSETELADTRPQQRSAGGQRRVFAATEELLTRAEIEALPSELVLAGSVVIEETDGSLTKGSNGRFRVATWIGDQVNTHVVQVFDGLWSLRFARQDDGTYTSPDGSSSSAQLASARLRLSELLLYDPHGEAGPLTDEKHHVFGTRDLELRVRRLHSLRLRVEDAITSSPLDRVTIFWTGGSSLAGVLTGDRSQQKLVVEDVSSPILLTDEQRSATGGVATYLVGSPGYAWTRLPMDLGSDGERVVKLERGGDLEIHLAGELPRETTYLRVRDLEAGRILASFTAHNLGPIEVEGLAAGPCSLQLETAGVSRPPVVLARLEVEVFAGTRKEVTLRWDRAPEEFLARLAGVLEIPLEWPRQGILLLAKAVDTPPDTSAAMKLLTLSDMRKLSEEAYAFEFPPLPAGRYQLELSPFQYEVLLHLPATGLTDFVFDIPPPVDIRVLVVDESTGAPAKVDMLYWSCMPPERIPDSPVFGESYPGFARAAPRSGEFEFQVPFAEIHVLWLRGGTVTYAPENHRFVAQAGGEYTLHVRPACKARILLLDHETRIPWPSELTVSATQLDGDGSLSSKPGYEGFGELQADRPGRYRIEVPTIPGFEPSAPIEIEVVFGETRVIEVQLTRQGG